MKKQRPLDRQQKSLAEMMAGNYTVGGSAPITSQMPITPQAYYAIGTRFVPAGPAYSYGKRDKLARRMLRRINLMGNSSIGKKLLEFWDERGRLSR